MCVVCLAGFFFLVVLLKATDKEISSCHFDKWLFNRSTANNVISFLRVKLCIYLTVKSVYDIEMTNLIGITINKSIFNDEKPKKTAFMSQIEHAIIRMQ